MEHISQEPVGSKNLSFKSCMVWRGHYKIVPLILGSLKITLGHHQFLKWNPHTGRLRLVHPGNRIFYFGKQSILKKMFQTKVVEF